jgi:hypothetical protein
MKRPGQLIVLWAVFLIVICAPLHGQEVIGFKPV